MYRYHDPTTAFMYEAQFFSKKQSPTFNVKVLVVLSENNLENVVHNQDLMLNSGHKQMTEARLEESIIPNKFCSTYTLSGLPGSVSVSSCDRSINSLVTIRVPSYDPSCVLLRR